MSVSTISHFLSPDPGWWHHYGRRQCCDGGLFSGCCLSPVLRGITPRNVATGSFPNFCSGSVWLRDCVRHCQPGNGRNRFQPPANYGANPALYRSFCCCDWGSCLRLGVVLVWSEFLAPPGPSVPSDVEKIASVLFGWFSPESRRCGFRSRSWR